MPFKTTTLVPVASLLLAPLITATPVPQAGSDCKLFTLLFARGTTESGTMGTFVGPSLQTAVESAFGDVLVQGVDYPADLNSLFSEAEGSGPGSIAMASDITAMLSKCPDTKLMLAGYSQGAMCLHNAAQKLGEKTMSSVHAAVTFGDPFKTQLPTGLATSQFHTFCSVNDTVCASSAGACAGAGGCASASTDGHLGYSADAATAASFLKSVVVGGDEVETGAKGPSVTTTSAAVASSSAAASSTDTPTVTSSSTASSADTSSPAASSPAVSPSADSPAATSPSADAAVSGTYPSSPAKGCRRKHH